ncbi:MAG: hypothetical protein KBG29_12425 [Pseudomonadales bacterium]|jgi:hypothetical protein|nr:hypothetical protein [Pseudomonadales bacterium]
MYLNRILLLVLVLLYVFAPMMTDWIAAGGTQWYRPHLIWLLVIATSALMLYRERKDGT